MKRYDQFLTPRLMFLFVTAMSSAIVFSGCREKRPAGQTISRTELDTIIKATSRSDSLTKALHSEFGARGYSFTIAFRSGGKDSNTVQTLSSGPASLYVSGAKTFDEAIELDGELNRVLEYHKLEGIEILYEIRTESTGSSPDMYPASMLAESAEFYAQGTTVKTVRREVLTPAPDPTGPTNP